MRKFYFYLLFFLCYNVLYSQCVNITTYPTSASTNTDITVGGTVQINNTSGNKIQQVVIYVTSTKCNTSGQIGYGTACASTSGTFTASGIHINNSVIPGTYYIWASVS